SRFLEPQRKFVLANRDLLLLEIIERFISEEGTIGDGHDQEERRVVVDELLVLSTRRVKHDILGVTPPPRHPLQHKVDVSIAKTAREKGTQSRPRPTVGSKDEGELYPIAFVDEN
ncbi:MAG: hypothetical protein Q9196_007480, partial [Gyalolechia fulgens]